VTPKNYAKDTGRPRRAVQKRELCGAIKPNKETCKLPAGYGTEHEGRGPCKHHFGNTARVVRGAALDEGKALVQMLKGMGVAADIDPGEALRWEVNNTLGHVAWHKRVIDTWNVLREDGSARPLTESEAEFYERYLAERQHLVRAARMAVAADVEGRAMRLAEQQADQMGNAMDRIFAALRLTEQQRALLPELVPAILREITATRPLELEGVFSTDDTLDEAFKQARRDSK
jgi:hypothetical protein